jgi:AcrR family transcriptional regulator
VDQARLSGLTDHTGSAGHGREENRERIVSAARQVFAQAGYEASVHDICSVAGVGIGTFYHQFLNKAELMHFLIDQEHSFRLEAFDALGPEQADATAGEVVRVISGSDPALLQAMIEACGIDARLRTLAREMRRETSSRLAAAFDRVRDARGVHRPALDSTTAASAALALGDTAFGRTSVADVERIVNILAFAEANGPGVRA